MVPTPTDMCYKYKKAERLLRDISSNQSRLTTQNSTRPRATQQGRVKCRHHITVPVVPTQGAIPEEGG